MDQLVAGARRERAQAAAFGAEDERQRRAAQVERVDRAWRIFSGADDADVALNLFAQRAREIGDHEYGTVSAAPLATFGDRRVDADRMVRRRDHRVGAGAVGDA